MNGHYHDEAWRKSREEEIVARQTDPEALLELTFFKDAGGWYADVPEHTRGQNQMVLGADRIIEHFAAGGNKVTVKFRTVPTDALGKPPVRLKRVEHDAFGATYFVFGLARVPFPAWLCNVTETVLGEHPKDIWVYGIERS